MADPDRSLSEVRGLVETMTVVESPEMSAAFPAVRHADVSITLRDGRVVSSGPTTAPGDPESPLTADQLEAKSRGSVTPLLGTVASEQLLNTVRHIEQHTLPTLMDALRPD